jgi:hypothetical protein
MCIGLLNSLLLLLKSSKTECKLFTLVPQFVHQLFWVFCLILMGEFHLHPSCFGNGKSFLWRRRLNEDLRSCLDDGWNWWRRKKFLWWLLCLSLKFFLRLSSDLSLGFSYLSYLLFRGEVVFFPILVFDYIDLKWFSSRTEGYWRIIWPYLTRLQMWWLLWFLLKPTCFVCSWGRPCILCSYFFIGFYLFLKGVDVFLFLL